MHAILFYSTLTTVHRIWNYLCQGLCPSSTLKGNENPKNPKASRTESVPDLKPRKYGSHPLRWVSQKRIISASEDVTLRQAVKRGAANRRVSSTSGYEPNTVCTMQTRYQYTWCSVATSFTLECVERAITGPFYHAVHHRYIQFSTRFYRNYCGILQLWLITTHSLTNESCIRVDRAKLTEIHDLHHHLINSSNRTARNSEESMHTTPPLWLRGDAVTVHAFWW